GNAPDLQGNFTGENHHSRPDGQTPPSPLPQPTIPVYGEPVIELPCQSLCVTNESGAIAMICHSWIHLVKMELRSQAEDVRGSFSELRLLAPSALLCSALQHSAVTTADGFRHTKLHSAIHLQDTHSINTLLNVKLSETENGKHVSILDLPGNILIIPQATLGGRVKGRNMQYHSNSGKEEGLELYSQFVTLCEEELAANSKCAEAGVVVEHGTYGSRQTVSKGYILPVFQESTVQALQAAEPSKGTHLEGEEQKVQAKPGALRRSLPSEEWSQGLGESLPRRSK
ncbi:hypothetical protein MC885_005957, partial [Smutsia gigantea]